MQQVFGFCNVLLNKDDATRQRKINMRTYRIVPLCADCGYPAMGRGYNGSYGVPQVVIPRTRDTDLTTGRIPNAVSKCIRYTRPSL